MLIGIVADDLTGAADAVEPFAGLGLRADVQWVRDAELPDDLPRSDARAWSTGTRDMPPGNAAIISALTAAAVQRLESFSPWFHFKKIDSTLRGHLRIELDAMRVALPDRIAVVCPAFPQNGRTVRNGLLHVNGEPRGSVWAAFGMSGDPSARELDLLALRSHAFRLSDRMMEWYAQGVRTVFCDAETELDMEIIATAVVMLGDAVLPVGSAGLSHAIAAEVDVTAQQTDLVAEARRELAERPVIVFVGSMHDASRRQAEFLAQRAGIAPILVRSSSDLALVSREASGQIEAGNRIVLITTPDEIDEPLPLGFGRALYTGFRETPLPVPGFGMVLTGGNTAEEVLGGISGCEGLGILGEIEPGVVLARVRGDTTAGSRPIILKAGGFGEDQTLARCVGL